MRIINSFVDLGQYGIVALTREADNLNYRVLCDVTQKGKELLEKVLGIKELQLHDNWNNGSDDDPHIGSILLSHNMIVDIAVIALLDSGHHTVYHIEEQMTNYIINYVVGISESDKREEYDIKEYHNEKIVRKYSYKNTNHCDRNNHLMSGRTV